MTGARLRVLASPGARHNEVVAMGDIVRVRVAAPPIEGRANEELLRFLAKRLHLPVSSCRVIHGGTGRQKLIEIEGLTQAEVYARLGLTPAGEE